MILCLLVVAAPARADIPRSPRTLQTDPPLNIVFLQDTNSAVTVFQIIIPAGIRTVPGNLRGLAFLAARAAMEIPSADDVKKLMEMGTQLSSWVEGDCAVLSMTTLSDHFADSLAILASMLNRPLVTKIRLQRIREWMQYRERAENDSPRTAVMQAMVDHFLSAHGYGGGGMGCEATRTAITRSHVINHLKKSYHAARMWISVVSDLDAEQVQKQLREQFKLTLAKNPPQPPPPATVSCPCAVSPAGDSGRKLLQPLVAWGMALPSLTAKSFVQARLLARLLAGGPGSPAWRLRDPLGLAYTVDCEVKHFLGGGVMVVFLRTGPQQVARTCREMETVFAELVETGVSRKQLDAAVELEKVDWRRRLQPKRETAWRLGSFAATGLGIDMVNQYDLCLDDLSIEEMNVFLRGCLSAQNRHRVILGVCLDPEEEKQ